MVSNGAKSRWHFAGSRVCAERLIYVGLQIEGGGGRQGGTPLQSADMLRWQPLLPAENCFFRKPIGESVTAILTLRLENAVKEAVANKSG